MRKSPIWDEETEERQEYLAETLEIATGTSVNTKTTLKEWRKELDELKEAKEKLTLSQKNMQNVLNGEQDYKELVKGSLKKLKKLKKEFTQRRKKLIRKNIDFQKVKGKTYKRGSRKVPAFIGGKRIKATPERFLKRGKVDIRLRTDKGYFASFVD